MFRRRSRNARTPAVLLEGFGIAKARSDALAHGSRGGLRIPTRVYSGVLMAMIVASFALFFATDAFYVHSIAVAGLETISREELYALTEIADYHIFWINPRVVESRLRASPVIADVRVSLGWPPQMVKIDIQERQPAIVWEQGGNSVWVDLQGQVMAIRNAELELLRVRWDGLAESLIGVGDYIAPDVVQGALQLHLLGGGVPNLKYRPGLGLGIDDTRGWVAWFGIGANMVEKYRVYESMVENLQLRGIQPKEISVSDLNAVYYR